MDKYNLFYSFNRSYEFEVTIPTHSLLRVQIWDWDMTSSNDMIAETKIDIENRFFSCHRATCGLPKRYDRLIK
jgi:Ca2+-dependent lipid-binding protein